MVPSGRSSVADSTLRRSFAWLTRSSRQAKQETRNSKQCRMFTTILPRRTNGGSSGRSKRRENESETTFTKMNRWDAFSIWTSTRSSDQTPPTGSQLGTTGCERKCDRREARCCFRESRATTCCGVAQTSLRNSPIYLFNWSCHRCTGKWDFGAARRIDLTPERYGIERSCLLFRRVTVRKRRRLSIVDSQSRSIL